MIRVADNIVGLTGNGGAGVSTMLPLPVFTELKAPASNPTEYPATETDTEVLEEL